MMNWFRRSSRSPSIRRTMSSSKVATDDRGAALYEAFRSHWAQANEIVIRQQEEQLIEPTAEQITAVFRHLDQMMLLLVTEVNAQNDLSIGPVLDGLFTENVLQRILLWTFSCSGENSEQCRRSMLRLYEGLLNQSQYCLLVHKPILLPMLTLLEECSRASPQQPDVEQLFVLLLNQICVKITDKDNAPLLEFFFNPSTDEGPPKFLVFTFLIPYLYNEGNVGQLARDALLLLLSVSANVESVGQFIAEHSNFCPVLATGLSALYSALPRRLASRADDWHRITDDDIDNIAEIRSFYNALEFCNAVVQVGHPLVLERLLDFIYHGFLVSVLGAALHENSLEELIAATAYLELFFRTATEPPLLRILLKFILSEQYDGVVLLETLVTRISSNSRLCIVSLALFETLLNLNCEDLLFELILKYLIPCTHIMVSQANNLTDIDYYGKSAQRFLSLVPNCCVTSRSCGISSASSASSLNAGDAVIMDRAVSSKQGNVPTSSSMENKFLSASYSASSSVTAPMNNGVVYEFEPEVTVKSREMAYAEYLRDANRMISQCANACVCWRFPYDGKTPDPALFREESPPSTSMSSGTNVVEHNRGTSVEESDTSACESPRTEVEQEQTDKKSEQVDKSSADGQTPSESESESKIGSQQPQQQQVQASNFKRNASFRKSRTNRYYNVRRLSQGAGGSIGTVPELDLTLGGEEGFEDEDDVELDAFETSDDGASVSVQKAATNNVESQDSTQSSTGSTPRHHAKNDVMSTSMPPDYFKLAFDEESLYGGVSDSQEESDIGGHGNIGSTYILRGWSQIQDMKTFMEVLNRVRASRTIGHQTAEEIMGYIEGVHDVVQRTASESSDDGGHKNVEAMASSKDSGVDVGDETNRDETTPAIIRIPIKSSFASPNIGPFLSVLLHKLDNMLQNSLFMNLHLTGVLARLACYPQILITSFLLNYSLVFQPAVRSLHQVLTSLRHKVDSYACTVENFDMLLLRGRIFLLQRERRHEINQRRRHSRSDSLRASSTTTISSSQSAGGRRNELDGGTSVIDAKNQTRLRQKKSDSRLRSITNLFPQLSASREDGSRNPNRRTGSLESPAHRSYQYFRKTQHNDLTLEAMKTKNVVYCAIVLEEFLKELAAISQEHAVRRGDLSQQQTTPPQVPNVVLHLSSA